MEGGRSIKTCGGRRDGGRETNTRRRGRTFHGGTFHHSFVGLVPKLGQLRLFHSLLLKLFNLNEAPTSGASGASGAAGQVMAGGQMGRC